MTGDFRMTFGEDRDKVINIVLPQVERFRELYAPLWPGLSQWAEFNVGTKKCDQDCSPTARLFHLNLLPKRIQVSDSWLHLTSVTRNDMAKKS